MPNLGLLILLMLAVSEGDAQTRRGRSCSLANGSAGVCIAIHECPPLRQLLSLIRADSAPPGSTDVLRQSICRFDNNEPLVCCTPTITPNPGPGLPSTTPSTSLLPSADSDQCGINGLTDRIIDGVPAPLKAWPWMVVLRGRAVGQSRSNWFCGGTLISDRYVLTAAHCFAGNVRYNLESARIGEHNLATKDDCEFGECAPPVQDIPVESIIRHPSYGSPCSRCNDIALLRLSRKAILYPLFVMPICLPKDPVRDMGFSVQEFLGKGAWAAGWGTTARDPNQPRPPDVLQQVQLPIREFHNCDFLKINHPDPAMVLCAGGEGKDTCRGDSGGPLTLPNSDGTRHFLVGVTSVGPRVCGASNTQGLYSSVNHYMSWITSTMRP